MHKVTLKKTLESCQTIVAPGVHDMISALLAEKVGFPAIFVGGYGISASHLGIPDVGIMTFTDILDRVRMIAEVTTKPMIVDADTGYGGLINLRHAVRCYEKVGVAAIQIEDQVFPKRCGHAEGVKVVSIEEMSKRIYVAGDNRSSEEFLIIARTDCRPELGIDEAIRRAESYSQAGADLIFVESPQNIQEITKIRANVDKPLVFKMVPDGPLSNLDSDFLTSLGFNLLIYPSLGFLSSANAMKCAFDELKNDGLVKKQSMYNFDDFSKLIGFNDIYDFEKRWGN